MRNFKIIVSLLLLLSLSDVSLLGNEKKVLIVHKKDVLKELIPVEGMTCVGCEVSLENAVLGIKGVIHVKASAKKKSAVIEFDKTKTDMDEIKKAIVAKGYMPK